GGRASDRANVRNGCNRLWRCRAWRPPAEHRPESTSQVGGRRGHRSRPRQVDRRPVRRRRLWGLSGAARQSRGRGGLRDDVGGGACRARACG
ncbi:MAG: hypothetical protein AVDCRST_MAG87-3006, partial [uncultured Thermomicrobiales bacterium]